MSNRNQWDRPVKRIPAAQVMAQRDHAAKVWSELHPGKPAHFEVNGDGCPRCGGSMTVHTTSYFNTDDICLQCKEDERGCPNWKRAYDAETEAVRSGQYNFSGIGLAAEDLAHLEVARSSRRRS